MKSTHRHTDAHTSWDFARIFMPVYEKSFSKVKSLPVCRGVYVGMHFLVWRALASLRGESKIDTQLSQKFPTVIEVGAIHKCMIYVKCPETDFEQPVREIIATTREQEENKQFCRQAWVACVSVPFPKLDSLLQVLLFLVVLPHGMPTAHGRHGSCWDFCRCFF